MKLLYNIFRGRAHGSEKEEEEGKEKKEGV
jgi:hypothetical protein